MSTGDVTSWEWTFEGGDPETSTEQNPTVTYNTVGSWDVTLTVNGDDGATFMVEDYMSIYEVPDVTMQPLDVACVFWAPYELTGGLPEGGEYSGPGVTDGMFDPEAAGIGAHLITYAYTSDDGCYNTAEETLMVDACTGIDEVKESAVKVYPNPASDVVHIASKTDMIIISIYSYTGQLIEKVQLSGKDYQFNTTSYPAGVYSIKIETEENIISKRLIIK
ncbi:MAG: T9SS type A sorting domain-containing protein [Bacteroidetes bacterium]|nr:T9SS type A sorting domain-containing protein [Bacteroidota bacterium]